MDTPYQLLIALQDLLHSLAAMGHQRKQTTLKLIINIPKNIQVALWMGIGLVLGVVVILRVSPVATMAAMDNAS